jgi:hypothetical protein
MMTKMIGLRMPQFMMIAKTSQWMRVTKMARMAPTRLVDDLIVHIALLITSKTSWRPTMHLLFLNSLQ